MESTIFQDISQQISSTMFKALSEQIGLPESLQSNLALAIEDNPWNLGLFKLLVQNPNGSPRDSGYGHHGGGCSDGFSIFGFLAFLLAAANLFMMDERKKRDINTKSCGIINEDNKKEVAFASYSMLRGFLNAVDAHDKVLVW